MNSRPKRLIFFDDNPDYGGHQVMSAHALDGLLESGEWCVHGLLNAANVKLISRWGDLQQRFGSTFTIETAATRTAKFQGLRNHWQSAAQARLLKQLRAFNPDLILCIQGNIEQSSAVFALHGKLQCPLVSYIPLPHTHAQMGAKLGKLRDVFCRGLYRIPDAWITISKTLAEQLIAFGARGSVRVVENGIPLDAFRASVSKTEARAHLNLPDQGFMWLHPGRVEFSQKGQDFSLDLFRRDSAKALGEFLVYLGSGPDSSRLKSLCGSCSDVFLLPWSDQPALVLAAADAVMLPSRYEGVPLVMLEALAMGIPVLATDRDGMKDWLPPEWRFSYRSEPAAVAAMHCIRKPCPDYLAALQQRVLHRHSLQQFKSEFCRALAGCV